MEQEYVLKYTGDLDKSGVDHFVYEFDIYEEDDYIEYEGLDLTTDIDIALTWNKLDHVKKVLSDSGYSNILIAKVKEQI